MLVACERQASPTEIKEALEGNDAEAKVLAMKKAIMLLLSGEQMPQLFITIVRYVLPSEDHTVQKLLLLYLVGAGEEREGVPTKRYHSRLLPSTHLKSRADIYTSLATTRHRLCTLAFSTPRKSTVFCRMHLPCLACSTCWHCVLQTS